MLLHCLVPKRVEFCVVGPATNLSLSVFVIEYRVEKNCFIKIFLVKISLEKFIFN